MAIVKKQAYEASQAAAAKAAELDEYYKMGCNPFAPNTYAQNKGTDVLIFT